MIWGLCADSSAWESEKNPEPRDGQLPHMFDRCKARYPLTRNLGACAAPCRRSAIRMQRHVDLSGPGPFEDVPAGRYFTEAVAWAYENEITTGKSPTMFAPYDPVTRVEFAAFLSRYDNLP